VRTAPAGECINLYDGEIAYTDHHIGLLMEGLARRGLDDDSLIVFAADHGEEFVEHGGWQHGGSLYQEQVHVPLIFSYPSALAPPGARIGGAVSTVDIVPTVLEAIGEPAPPGDGASLVASMRERRAQDSVAYAEETLHKAPGGWGFVDLRCARRGPHKLIHVLKQVNGYARPDIRDTFMLYDLDQDPYERKNIWQGPHDAEAKAELLELLRRFSARAPQAARTRRSGRGLPPEVRKNLKALGYLQ
jgi:arylsulfatase A-like enzyme